MRFALYASGRGNYFYEEMRHLLRCGLKELGYDAVERDEKDGFDPRASRHIIVAPHEFFYFGSGARLRMRPWPAGVVLYNSEPLDSSLFRLTRRLLPRAHAIWEMDGSTSRALAEEGWQSSFVPLGWTPGCEYFEPAHGRSSPSQWSRRPIDLLFVGARSDRRDSFFSAARDSFRGLNAELRLVNPEPILRSAVPSRTRTFIRLARRAKIVLHVHRNEESSRYFPWHRIALHGIGQGALVITEDVENASPLIPGRDFLTAELGEIVELIGHHLRSAQGRAEAAKTARRGFERYKTACRLSGFLGAAISRLDSRPSVTAAKARLREAIAASILLETRPRALTPAPAPCRPA